MTMQLIETKTLSASVATVEFTSIPQTYTDLVLFVSARFDFTNVGGSISFNGVTTGFQYRGLFADGSSASADTSTSRAYIAAKSTYSTSTFGNSVIYILNYAGSTQKAFTMDQVNENNSTAADSGIRAGLWANTAAITSLSLDGGASNFVSGSSFSLYGILKGSDGIVTTS